MPPHDHDCPICYDPINAGTGEVRMSCSHIFHLSCIGTWLQAGNHNCPYCRRTVQETERLTPPAADPAAAAGVGLFEDIIDLIAVVNHNAMLVGAPVQANQTFINAAFMLNTAFNNNLIYNDIYNNQLENQYNNTLINNTAINNSNNQLNNNVINDNIIPIVG
jgi:hypothetical protein